ncbi:MAG: hypothetical protein AVDCRST_MAG26-3674, partial [uncultured Chloroflexia bacterium]
VGKIYVWLGQWLRGKLDFADKIDIAALYCPHARSRSPRRAYPCDAPRHARRSHVPAFHSWGGRFQPRDAGPRL